MGPDTEQNIRTQVSAATEAVNLFDTALKELEKKVKKVADRLDRHITAEQRAEAARRATYEANFKKED